MNKSLIVKQTQEEALDAATGIITDALSEAGKIFHLAVSGGGTAVLLFNRLATAIPAPDIPRLQLWWVDERCVSPEDDQSNYGHALKTLIRPLQLPDSNVHRMHGETDPEIEANRYSRLLEEQLPFRKGLPAFDMIFLGMGEDGHTASLFPGDESAFTAEEPVTTARHPVSGQMRITLTPACINNAGTVFFLVTGEGKSETLEKVFYNIEKPPLPAARIRPENGELIWIMDTAAAKKME